VTAPRTVHRVTYSANVADLPEWRWLSGSNRWDDPASAELYDAIAALEAMRAIGPADEQDEEQRIREMFAAAVEQLQPLERPYRVLYTSHSRRGAYAETFQGYRAKRPGAATARARVAVQSVLLDASDVATPPVPLSGPGTGFIGIADIEGRFVGEIEIDVPQFANVEDLRTVQYLREPLLPLAEHYKLEDVNRGAILGKNYNFTRRVSEFLYQEHADVAGIWHESTLGRPHQNWAIFERPRGGGTICGPVCRTVARSPLSFKDPELREVLRDLGVQIVEDLPGSA
jgi:hypothetical protein